MGHSYRTPNFAAWRAALAGFAVPAAVLLFPSGAEAQVKQPGAHVRYSVELEPHAAIWWQDRSRDDWDNESGWGLGWRGSVPIVEEGFISSINNSVAIGFGIDWGRYSHRCWWRDNRDQAGDCDSNELWFPVVMQWNFFLTKSFSVFGEPGLAIRHSRWSWPNATCPSPNGPVTCEFSDSDTGLEPVFFAGGRLGNESVSFTFRLGWPYASVGASFFL